MFLLPEQVIIQNVEQLHRDLNGLMDSGEPVVLDASKVIKVDTAGLQLLCSVQKGLKTIQQQIVWHEIPEVIQRYAQLIGVDDFLEFSVIESADGDE